MSATAPPHDPPREEPDALIDEAWQHAHLRRRRRFAAMLVGGVALAAVLALTWPALSHRDASRDRGGRAASSGVDHTSPRYLYTRAVLTRRPVLGQEASSGPTVIENWVGSDGSWRLRETIPGRAPGSLDIVIRGDGLLPPQTNATSAFDGPPVNPRDPGDGLFTAGQLTALPDSVTALSARLRQAIIAQDLRNLDAYVLPGPHRASQLRRLRPTFVAHRTRQTLLAIADLDLTPAPHGLTYALYRVARTLPVRVTATRDRVAVAGDRYSLTFDAHTGALRSTSTGGFFDQGSAGTVIAQARVANLDAIPRGITRLPSLVPQPPAITLSPHAGTGATSFTLHMTLPNAATRTPSLLAEMFGPTGPNCVFWASPPPAAHIAPGAITHQAHLTLATYQVTPAAIGRHTWCPGRYQLMLTPITTTHGRVAVPRSFAATYFNIH